MSTARAERTTKPRPLADAALAVAFLTIVPVRVRDPHASLARAAALLPARRRGGRRGGGRDPARVRSPCSAPARATVLALVVLVGLTGALHQDGLADIADGLGARGDRDRRLAVMRDSAIGAFGVLALIGWALLLATTLAALRARPTPCSRWSPPARCRAGPRSCTPPPRRPPAATASAPDSRPPRRPSSSQAPPHWRAAELAGGALPGLAAIAATLVVSALTSAWARRALGGRTGDTLGATVALAELAACAALLAAYG